MIRERVRQVRHAGVAPTAADYALARGFLSGQLLALFEAQHPRDIVHSANTARWLLDRGYDDRELIEAALLHDVGKGQQRTADRVVHVVAGWLRLGALLADEDSSYEVRRAVARARSHSESGAIAIEAAGASPRVVDLVRRHHEPAGRDDMLNILQRADART